MGDKCPCRGLFRYFAVPTTVQCESVSIVNKLNISHAIRVINFRLSDTYGRKYRRAILNKFERNNLVNSKFTILSQNCIGSVMYHDLGVRFSSPTINVRFDPNEFVIFLEDIEHFLKEELVFVKSDCSYPVAKLCGVTIEFVHYKSSEEARHKWQERKSRINWDNIFVICTDENMSMDMIRRFDGLCRFPNKILFTNKYLPQYSSTVYVPELKENGADLLQFSNPFGKRRYQKYIDYVEWLNSGL